MQRGSVAATTTRTTSTASTNTDARKCPYLPPRTYLDAARWRCGETPQRHLAQKRTRMFLQTRSRIIRSRGLQQDSARRAITLVEVLVACAIIALIAGMTAPVIVRARRSGVRTAVVANMRQCLIGMAIYCDEMGLDSLPSLGTLRDRLDADLTWDPFDNWRRDKMSNSMPEMLGSYGYAGSIPLHDSWIAKSSSAAVLVDVFQGVRPLPKPHAIDPTLPLDLADVAYLPDRALVGRWDTSVGLVHLNWSALEEHMYFNWFHIFMTLNNPRQGIRHG